MKDQPSQDENRFRSGFLASLIFHLLGGALAIYTIETGAADAVRPPEIFTVTLEGGEKLGGFTQVPDPKKKSSKLTPSSRPEATASKKDAVPEPIKPSEPESVEEPEVVEKAPEVRKEPQAPKEPEPEVETKKLKSPSVVKDPEIERKKKLAEQKKLQDAKAKAEAKAKKRKAEKEKARALKAKKEEAAKKKAAKAKKAKRDKEEAAKKKEIARMERDRRLAAIADRMKKGTEYSGESANAGGEGFGAARLGGKGMGGGALASAEKIAYANALQQHVKAGWRWLSGREKLRTLIVVNILRDGRLNGVSVARSSGNSKFDDSVVRAVRKADPVPIPPAAHYSDFSSVRFWFDSHDQ